MAPRSRSHAGRFTGTLLGAEIARSSLAPPLVEKGEPEAARRPGALALLASWWRIAAVFALAALGLLALRR
jgi:hypothetical protein